MDELLNGILACSRFNSDCNYEIINYGYKLFCNESIFLYALIEFVILQIFVIFLSVNYNKVGDFFRIKPFGKKKFPK